ncbi:MAG: glycosyltransferase [bacterium]|nr:glycosyltransferase [bacterium]
MSLDFRFPELPLAEATTAGALADRLVAATAEKMAEFEQSAAPGFKLPGLYAGHPVLDDTTADLMYVLGLLIDCGVDEVAGCDLQDRIPPLIASLEPAAVEAFASYRVGETVLRLGGLEALPADLRQPVLDAVYTKEIIARLDDTDAIPPNFAVVSTRCLRALAHLRGGDEPAELPLLLERVRSMFTSPTGWLNDGMGNWAHYDIYTPDMYLFAEPLADQLGSGWADGLSQVLRDLDEVSQPGGAVVWGRSIGALGMAITIELAAIAAGRDLDAPQDRWLARADAALDDLLEWFPSGVIAAHQNRAAMFYRGPARRLQMTLDIYGKLLLSALELRRKPGVASAPSTDVFPPAERFVEFDDSGRATVWSYRSKSLSFALPTLFGFSADYGCSPRGPGLLEQPTSGHPVMLPVISPRGRDEMAGTSSAPLIPAGLPVSVEHTPGSVTLVHEGWAPAGSSDPVVAGSRTATYRVEGRSLVVSEQLRFDDPAGLPGPLTLSVAEPATRPIHVAIDAGRVQAIDTAGIAEWRSFWGELPRVYQAEIEPASSVDFTWKVTPRLRVASTIHGHPYDRSLYDPLADRVVATGAGIPDDKLIRRLRDIDVLHMAWPEWWSGVDPERTAEVLSQVKATGTAIVWTQHNLLPHFFKTDDAAASYQSWAEAADAVIHHSEVGRDVALAAYRYGTHTEHHVIPHGHWGREYESVANTTRQDVELSEGWAPYGLRVAVIGTPRVEKDLQLVVDAVAACGRDDIQLVIRVDLSVAVPDDPRIIAEHGHLDFNQYLRRMKAFDAVILPFAPSGMLTTGTAFDCLGAGVPAITSDWDFFDETFAGADIRYGSTVEDLARCLDKLTPQELDRSRQALIERRPAFDWDPIADQTLAVLEAAALSKA